MNDEGTYTPSRPGAVECPACGAVLAVLPVADLPCQLVALAGGECPRCGQRWEDMRHLGDSWAKRYWTPQPTPAA
jgi:hypothetical protein